MKLIYDIEGVRCTHEIPELTTIFRSQKGVSRVYLDGKLHLVSLEFNPEDFRKEALVNELALKGYSIELTHKMGLSHLVLSVTGMNCLHCETRIRSALFNLIGIETMDISLQEGRIHVRYRPGKVVAAEIIDVVQSLGYGATAVGEHTEINDSESQPEKAEWRLVLLSLLFFGVVILTMGWIIIQ